MMAQVEAKAVLGAVEPRRKDALWSQQAIHASSSMKCGQKNAVAGEKRVSVGLNLQRLRYRMHMTETRRVGDRPSNHSARKSR